MKKRKIAFVTVTRTDYGLMKPILQAVDRHENLELRLYHAGLHLMPEYGLTAGIVKKDFPHSKSIGAIFESDERADVNKFMADLMIKMTGEFIKNRPDFVLNIGDRPEVLAIAAACLYLGIPSGHIHGGDKTSTVDEFTRHAITKLSHFHFPAIKPAAERIRRLGEEKWRIKVVGAPALEVIKKRKLLTKKELYEMLKINPEKPYIMLLQHPTSGSIDRAGIQMKQTLEAVKTFHLPAVAIYPNGDPGSHEMIDAIEREQNNPLFRIFPNLEHEVFLSLEKYAAAWVGNSSAAMIESASFKTPVVDIGPRQTGRLHGANVIHVGHDRKAIEKAIEKSLHDVNYGKKIKNVKNPWGDGNTSNRITKILSSLPLNDKLMNKQITY